MNRPLSDPAELALAIIQAVSTVVAIAVLTIALLLAVGAL